jgi:hypothetical protein
MPLLVLEELRPGGSAIIASSPDSAVIAQFWRCVLAEADATVAHLENTGDETLAALERAERDRLYRIAPLFGGPFCG